MHTSHRMRQNQTDLLLPVPKTVSTQPRMFLTSTQREAQRKRKSGRLLKREAANAIFGKKVLCKKVLEESSVRVTLAGFHRVLVPLGHLIILLPSKNFPTGLVRLFTIWSLLVSTSSSIFQTYHLLFLLFKHTNLSTQCLLTGMFL